MQNQMYPTLSQKLYGRLGVSLLISGITLFCLLWLYVLLEESMYPFSFLHNSDEMSIDVINQYHQLVLIGSGFVSLCIGVSVFIIANRYEKMFLGVADFVLWILASLILLYGCILWFSVSRFVFPERMQVITSTENYKVIFMQSFNYDPFISSKLEIVVVKPLRSYARVILKEDADPGDGTSVICTTLAIKRIDNRIYFLCDNEKITENTSYIDLDTSMLYPGWDCLRQQIPLNMLPFDKPVKNICEIGIIFKSDLISS
jgi:hypothetical protein